MADLRKFRVGALVGLASLVLVAACSDAPQSGGPEGQTASVEEQSAKPELNFRIQEGKITNRFYRNGPNAAHLVLTSGQKPRLIVAFPAGNSGVSLWFEETGRDTVWHETGAIEPVSYKHDNGATLYGIETDLSVEVDALVVRQSVLGSVRVIRNYLHGAAVPDNLRAEVAFDGDSLIWSRERLDGKSAYELRLDILAGSAGREEGGQVVLRAPEDGPLKLRLTALSGDKPLTPIARDALVSADAADHPSSLNSLAFLTYEEKLLAGSWRFLTYFGRDTLLSLRLLMPVLQPAVAEAGLRSVLLRLNEKGEVAHEEEIGEFALIRSAELEGKASLDPLYDHTTVDDNFMLAPVLADYVLNRPGGRERADAFLSQDLSNGKTVGEALISNIAYVIEQARAFAQRPATENLIHLKDGARVGEWRDSQEGLGGGRIPFNVNAALVPAALKAIQDLSKAGLLSPYLADGLAVDTQTLGEWAAVWRQDAPQFFRIHLSRSQAVKAVSEHAQSHGLPDEEAVASIDDDGVRFHAVSLAPGNRRISILQSDEGFRFLFQDLSAEEINFALDAMMRPYPAGLLTPAGLLVSNAAYAAEPSLKAIFTRGHYHGETVWSWQQAMFVAGIKRQLAQPDLPPATTERLTKALAVMARLVEETAPLRNSELWSWTVEDGKIKPDPFGQGVGHKTESNAAQLWSTVFLAFPDIGKASD